MTDLTFRELCADFLQSRALYGRSPATLKYYRVTTRRFLAWADVAGVTPATFGQRELRAYLAELQTVGRSQGYHQKAPPGGPLREATLRVHAGYVRTLLRFAAEEGLLASAPALKLPKLHRSRPAFLKDDEVARVIEACCTPRDRALVCFMLDSALRRSEVCALTWTNLSFDGITGSVLVMHGKGDKQRTAYFTATTWRLLQQIGPGDPDESVFGLGLNGLRSALARIGQDAGIPLRPHLLRHTAARRMLQRHVPVPAAQAILGHYSSALTVDLYGQFDEQMAAAAYREGMCDAEA